MILSPPPRQFTITAFDLAQRFVGLAEVPGTQDNPHILAMLRLDDGWPPNDETPWCSAFANYVCWLLRLPRSKSLRARSWLSVGQVVDRPHVGFDVVILNRENGPRDPNVRDAPGHVGFFAGLSGDKVALLGGNQGNRVSIASFPIGDVLGYRRVWP